MKQCVFSDDVSSSSAASLQAKRAIVNFLLRVALDAVKVPLNAVDLFQVIENALIGLDSRDNVVDVLMLEEVDAIADFVFVTLFNKDKVCQVSTPCPKEVSIKAALSLSIPIHTRKEYKEVGSWQELHEGS